MEIALQNRATEIDSNIDRRICVINCGWSRRSEEKMISAMVKRVARADMK